MNKYPAKQLLPLNRTWANLLVALHDAGGTGDIDMHGRVFAGTPPKILPGDQVAWLVLVSRGYVAGDGGYILITEEGRSEALRLLAGRTVGG